MPYPDWIVPSDRSEDYGVETDWTPLEVPEGLRIPVLDGEAP